jgi:hypothetical protein
LHGTASMSKLRVRTYSQQDMFEKTRKLGCQHGVSSTSSNSAASGSVKHKIKRPTIRPAACVVSHLHAKGPGIHHGRCTEQKVRNPTIRQETLKVHTKLLGSASKGVSAEVYALIFRLVKATCPLLGHHAQLFTAICSSPSKIPVPFPGKRQDMSEKAHKLGGSCKPCAQQIRDQHCTARQSQSMILLVIKFAECFIAGSCVCNSFVLALFGACAAGLQCWQTFAWLPLIPCHHKDVQASHSHLIRT